MNDPTKLIAYRVNIFSGIRKMAQSRVNCFQKVVIPYKLNTAIRRLYVTLYQDSIATCVGGDSKAISEKEFLSATETLISCYPEHSRYTTEASLRNALREIHYQSFEEAAKFYSVAEKVYPELVGMESEKNSLLELQEETIQEMKKAEFEKQTAWNLLTKFGHVDPVEASDLCESDSPNMIEVKKKYKEGAQLTLSSQK